MIEKASKVELFENVNEHIPRSLCPYYVNNPVYRPKWNALTCSKLLESINYLPDLDRSPRL